ncbi:MAG TPA: alkaline phosphatase family protein [Trebonia sp.]
MSGKRWGRALAAMTTAAIAAAVAGCTGSSASPPKAGGAEQVSGGPTGSYLVPAGIHKIKHVVVIMQENRSFDNYFGTFPGADGIPESGGEPSVCVPDPRTRQCVRPYADHADANHGGPHTDPASVADVDSGKMNGFIASAEQGPAKCAADPTAPNCTHGTQDVMGYHTASDIPNYWTLARDYALQDHMYESVHSWSFPSHLYLVSGWAATCASAVNPMSCTGSAMPAHSQRAPGVTPFAWTDITYLLHKDHVSWGWFLDHGATPDETTITPSPAAATGNGLGRQRVPQIWNVLLGFTDVHTDHQLSDIQPDSAFFTDAQAGALPSVSWLMPDGPDSEHPPFLVSTGESYVTRIIDAVMRSPDWSSSAIFLAWDDWGGFYDQVVPPTASALGYGIRVPGIVISPYAKKGYIDHQTLSFDAYLKFIEDDFLGGQRLNPKTDDRPDSRPVVVEDASILGNLVSNFDFSQPPRPPAPLPVCPRTTLTGTPAHAPYCHGDPPPGYQPYQD